MSENTKLEKRAKLSEIANEIDSVASSAMEVFEQAGSFADELAVAQAIVDMRQLLTPEIMAPIMALMNTDLGFRTDRDPKTAKEPVTPYSVEVVREVFIESKLRGFHTCGNEFNIIAGRFYGAQNGFKRKVKELTSGTFEPSFDAPVISQDGKQAKIKCRATWLKNGSKFDIGVRPEDSCEFLIRVNAFMGADAIVGKADRKLNKRVFERLTGRTIPDGDANDIEVGSVKETPKPKFEPKPEAAPKTEKAEEKPAETAKPTQPENVVAIPSPTQIGGETLQAGLAETLFLAGVSFEDFRGWLKSTGRYVEADSLGSFDDVSDTLCNALIKDKKALPNCITLYGKK